MFEEMTYEKVLAEMLENVSGEKDKREGSIIWDALAPAALALSQMYQALDEVLQQGFADTAEREYLILRAKERGLEPYVATYAGAIAEIEGEIALGSRFYCGGFVWQAEEKLSEGRYLLRAEESGSAANSAYGRLTPLEYQENLGNAKIVDIAEPAADEEDTEVFRERYFTNLSEQAFGGNRADYIEKALGISGVGAVKVQSAFDGGGTVRLILMDSTFDEPSLALIEKVQNIFDPVESSGKGLGLAPIGHKVTVSGAVAREIAISFELTLLEGYAWSEVESAVLAAIDAYLVGLAENWAKEERIVVRISQLEACILAVTGIADVGGTTFDGTAENLVLAEEEFPRRGDVNAG